MVVKIKRRNKSIPFPSYNKIGDAGMDLVAVTREHQNIDMIAYGTGLALEIPKGFFGLIVPRSSITKYDLMLANGVGIVDSGFRGEIFVKMNIMNNGTHFYNVGDRVAQLIVLPFPEIEFQEVDELSATERGTGGFGSTGK